MCCLTGMDMFLTCSWALEFMDFIGIVNSWIALVPRKYTKLLSKKNDFTVSK